MFHLYPQVPEDLLVVSFHGLFNCETLYLKANMKDIESKFW